MPVHPELRGTTGGWSPRCGGRRRGEAAPDRDPDEVADALAGCCLSRRLCRRRVDDWALTAIETIIC